MADAIDRYCYNDEVENQPTSRKGNGKMYPSLVNWVEEMCNEGLSTARFCKVNVQRKDHDVKDDTDSCANPNQDPQLRERHENLREQDEKRDLDEA